MTAEHRRARVAAAARDGLRRLADRGGALHRHQQRHVRVLLPLGVDARLHRRSTGTRVHEADASCWPSSAACSSSTWRPCGGPTSAGALAGLPALALVAMGLGQWKVRWRTVRRWPPSPRSSCVAVLGWLDLTRDSADRSHLGRLLERIGSDGSSGLTTVVERKLAVNLRSLTESTWRYIFGPLAIAARPDALARPALGPGRRRRRSRPAPGPPRPARPRRPRLRRQRLGHRRAGRHARRRGARASSTSPCRVEPAADRPRRSPDASAGVIAFGLLFAGGVVAAAAARAGVGARARARRRCAGATTATTSWPPPAGIVIVLAVLVVEAARTALAEFGVGEELSDSLLRSMVLFACFAFAFLGLDRRPARHRDRPWLPGPPAGARPRSPHHRRDEAVRRWRWWPSS